MRFKKNWCTFAIILFSFIVVAQPTTVYTEAQLAYKKGVEYYDKGIFGLAQKEFQKSLSLLQPTNEPEFKLLQTQAELYFAKSAVRLNQPDGEKLILDFARTHDPDPLADQAIFEMGNYYYNSKAYEKAAELFSRIDVYDLSKNQRSEVKFKLGYSYFVKKRFTEARTAFAEIKDIQNEYYYPSNYYYGMTSFYNNRYEEAIGSFENVKRSKKYAPYIPYYITQIYFSQGDYNKVIEYAGSKTEDKDLKNLEGINQLVGQAYFELGDFDRARPLLEYYVNNTNKMRPEDFYQLGYVQYKAGSYAKAIENFEQLGRVKNAMGQSAMFALGDSHLKTGNKPAALNAFKAASKMDFDADTQEEALYNYAKLSYELNFDREAVSALQTIQPGTKHHNEAQALLSAIFLNTRDYENAISILENIPDKSPEMRETYQKVAYLRGLQLYREGDGDGASKMFNTSLTVPIDTRTKALSIYWLGEIAYNNKDYDGSVREMNKFLTLGKSLRNLPDEASVYTANYIQGYNYLKQENYQGAFSYFQNAANGIKDNARFISNPDVAQKILGDAVLRAGDCLFKRNQYNDAVKYYDEAVKNRYSGFVYALYQKAIIEGLRGNTTDKIINLDDLVDTHPDSEYADDALLQLGITYLEIGKFEQAIVPLKRIINNYQNSKLTNQALLKLGLISYNQGNLESAIAYYKQVFAYNPSQPEAEAALTALEEIYVDDLGKTEEYFAFLETIPGYKVEEDEKEHINFKAAESQYANGNYEKAIQAFSVYIRQYPNGRNLLLAHYHRGESYAVEKRYSDALRDYEFVIGKGNSLYYTKALKKAAIIAYNHDQNFEKAYDFYSKLELATDNSDTRFEAQIGALRSAYRTNDYEAVSTLAVRVIENPTSSDQHKASANFYLGKMAFDKEDYDKALRAFNEVTKQSNDEQTAEARYTIAYIYYLKRELEVAQQIALNANKESSDYPYWVAKSVILLADILAEKGDIFNAQAVLEGLIENYTEDEELVNIAKTKLEQLKARESSTSRLLTEPTDKSTLELIDPNEGGN